MSELAERAGLSVPTIKYYVREGLLPPAPVKTGRTMAYYDQAYLDRLRLIRSLREEHFLPVRVIKQILADRGDRPFSPDEAALLARIGPAVLQRIEGDATTVPRAEVLARYQMDEDDLDLLIEMGLVGDERTPGQFGVNDVALLDAMRDAEQIGITRERFPVSGLGHYVELLDELAKREVRIFAHRTIGLPETEQLELAQRAIAASEPIVALIRRKFILRAIRTELVTHTHTSHTKKESP